MTKPICTIILILISFCIAPSYSFGTLPNSAIRPFSPQFIESHIFDTPAINANKYQLNRKKQHIQHKNSGNLAVSYDQYDAAGNLRPFSSSGGFNV